MSLSTFLRRNPLTLISRAPASCSSKRTPSQWPALRPNVLPKHPYLLQRTASTAPTRRTPSYKYPELLNLYRSGVFTTVSQGFFRIFTLGVAGVALLLIPTYALDPDQSNWWIPVFIIGAPLPYAVLTLLHGPVVHAVHIRLPAHARKSKDALLQWARQTPVDAQVRLECIRLLPWPTAREVRFGPLRKIKPGFKVGLSNLEYSPAFATEYKGTVWHELFQRWTGRYWISRDQKRDRSQAPGLWDIVWAQIPEAGSEEDPERDGRRDKKPLDLKDRPVVRPTVRPALKTRRAR